MEEDRSLLLLASCGAARYQATDNGLLLEIFPYLLMPSRSVQFALWRLDGIGKWDCRISPRKLLDLPREIEPRFRALYLENELELGAPEVRLGTYPALYIRLPDGFIISDEWGRILCLTEDGTSHIWVWTGMISDPTWATPWGQIRNPVILKKKGLPK
jgi:hypothetical protein